MDIGSTALGEASEHLAIARLLLRGHKVFRPVADDHGVDLLVDGFRVQVKCARSVNRPMMRGVEYSGNYNFFLKQKVNPDSVDVLMCYALDVDKWWIIPMSALRLDMPVSTLQLCLVPRAKMHGRAARLCCWLERWDVFDETSAQLSSVR